ncbi:MAG TPA: hypothetical protein VK184_26590 [Nostocaceae cyanobacterium]|nr:hypothetical protein [Nostocaceae cyanobacterium]
MIQIIAEPLEFSLKDRTNFKVGLKAKNIGNRIIETKLYETALLVNGEPSLAWNLAISNGVRDESWWNLKPEETVTASWHLGEALFLQPGEYNILLRYGSQDSSVRVRVTP